jgi:hypothetical protein
MTSGRDVLYALASAENHSDFIELSDFSFVAPPNPENVTDQKFGGWSLTKQHLENIYKSNTGIERLSLAGRIYLENPIRRRK